MGSFTTPQTTSMLCSLWSFLCSSSNKHKAPYRQYKGCERRKEGEEVNRQGLEEREVLWPLDLKVHTLVTDPLCRERGAPGTVPLVLRSYTSQWAGDPLEAGCSESNGWRRGPCRDMLGTICARNSWVSGTQNKVYKGRGGLQVDTPLSLHGLLRQWEAKGEPWGRKGSSCQDLRVLLLLQWEFPAGTITMTATTVYTFI